ncbi:hypothetical protein B0H19DRAFT_1078145 [Mycena capillaripes]|nr:hypothetical protein B0H19DRAFT_1078145 [Mycena capillaripes]
MARVPAAKALRGPIEHRHGTPPSRHLGSGVREQMFNRSLKELRPFDLFAEGYEQNFGLEQRKACFFWRFSVSQPTNDINYYRTRMLAVSASTRQIEPPCFLLFFPTTFTPSRFTWQNLPPAAPTAPRCDLPNSRNITIGLKEASNVVVEIGVLRIIGSGNTVVFYRIIMLRRRQTLESELDDLLGSGVEPNGGTLKDANRAQLRSRGSNVQDARNLGIGRPFEWQDL